MADNAESVVMPIIRIVMFSRRALESGDPLWPRVQVARPTGDPDDNRPWWLRVEKRRQSVQRNFLLDIHGMLRGAWTPYCLFPRAPPWSVFIGSRSFRAT